MTAARLPERLAWRSTGEIAGRILRAASTWAWAQHLSADTFGVLTHAWTVNLVLAQAFSLALPTLLLRQATSSPEHAAGYWRDAQRLRLLLAVPELLVLAGLIMRFHFEPPPLYLLLFVAVTAGACADLAAHFLMARGAWRAEAQATLAGSLVVALASCVTMWRGGGVMSAAACVLLGNAFGVVWAVAAARKHTGESVQHLPLAWRQVAPWALLGLIEQASYQLEVLWLDAQTSHSAVAHFSAVFRILGLSAPVMIVANQLLLRSATRLAGDREALTRLTRSGLWLGSGLGLLSGALAYAVMPRMLPILYPFADQETASVARHLSFILVFWFANTGLIQVARGQGRLRALIVWSALQLCAQAGLCAWLVPTDGATGAATAKVLAAAGSTLLLLFIMRADLRQQRPT